MMLVDGMSMFCVGWKGHLAISHKGLLFFVVSFGEFKIHFYSIIYRKVVAGSLASIICVLVAPVSLLFSVKIDL